MIMDESYKEEIIEYVRSLPDSVFSAAGRKKENILTDAECIDKMWTNYQKEVVEYECDPEYAKKDTLNEVLGIDVDKNFQPVPAPAIPRRKEKVISDTETTEIPAGDIKPGMVILKNNGSKELVQGTKISATGKSITIDVLYQDSQNYFSHKEYSRTLRTCRLVAVQKQGSYAAGKKPDADIRDIAYQKYQLNWMLDHGYSLDDLVKKMTDVFTAYDDFFSPQSCYNLFLSDFGFGGELFASYQEFLECEYRNKEYIKSILTKEQYLDYLKAESSFRKHLYISEEKASLYKKLLSLPSDQIREEYGDLFPCGEYRKFHQLTETVKFENNQAEMDITLRVPDYGKEKPSVLAILHIEGEAVVCKGPSDSMTGEFSSEWDDQIYSVVVEPKNGVTGNRV